MLHGTDRLSLTVLVVHTGVLLALIHSCRGQSEVIGPSQPIVALVGDDIILPCRLQPVMNALDMTVEWARPDLDPRFVLVWRDGMELHNKKHPSYRGRTSLSTDGLKLGNVSLKLSSVKISDEGTYRCFIPQLHRSPTVQLLVGSVSWPIIQTRQSSGGGGVLLQCESGGWYPEPEVLWLDGEGHVLSAGPTETLRRPDGLHTVSSRLTVDTRPNNNFTCRVGQKNINQTRETHVHVPDHFFMVSSTPGVIIGSITGCAVLLFIPVVLVVVWKWRQKKLKNKRRSPEDEPEQTEEEKMVTSKSTGFQTVMEGEEERVALMAGIEEGNNVDSRGEESERKDETLHDRFVTEGRGEIKPIKQKDEGEGEQMIKPGKEDSGLPLVRVVQNVHMDQDVQKEKDPMNEVDQTEAKTENEQEKVGSGSMGEKKQQENWREQMQPEVERSSMKLEAIKSYKIKEKDKLKFKQQKGGGSRHVLEDRRQEESKGEHEEKMEKYQEGSQSNITTTTERKAENQTEQMNERLKETKEERELQRPEEIKKDEEKMELQTHEDVKQVLQKAEHLDKKGKDQEGNQSKDERLEKTEEERDERLKETEEEKDERLKETKEERDERLKETKEERDERLEKTEEERDERLEKTEEERDERLEKTEEERDERLEKMEEERDERENKPPSVQRPDVQIYEEPAGRKHQEIQEEKQQEDESEKEQLQRSSEEVKIECKERLEDELESDEGAEDDEYQNKFKIRQEGRRQQQVDVMKRIRKQDESSDVLTERGVKHQEVEQEKIDTRRRFKVTRPKQEQKVPVVRKRRHREEGTDTEDIQEAKKRPYGDEMKYMKLEVREVPQRVGLMQQDEEDQQEAQMETQEDQPEAQMDFQEAGVW